MEVYEAVYNVDRTEGRGPEVTVGYFMHAEHAAAAIRGKGVMGVGDGDVYKVTVHSHYSPGMFGARSRDTREKVYGYRKRPDGRWDYGWLDLRDLLEDPDYAEYLRLKERFE